MSKRDERLAAKYAARGKESASDRNRRKAAERQTRDSAPSATGLSTQDAMRQLIAAPRSSESRLLGRASRRAAADNGGGESFADRDAKSTTGWFRRGR